MRIALACSAIVGAACAIGCGVVESGNAPADAATGGGDAIAASDAATCTPRTLLMGGTNAAAQGWQTQTTPPEELTSGANFVELQTRTNSGAAVSGTLLLVLPGAVDPGQPFTIEVVIEIVQVTKHNQFDSAAAIMGSFSGGFGSTTERSEMVYLDASAIGWADDSQMFAATLANQQFHTYALLVDAAGKASVTVDGIAALTRTGFTTNGTIAIGDQTNDAGVDSTLQIRSVRKLCP